MAIPLDRSILLASSAVLLAVAGIVLALGVRHGLNRALAALLAARGLVNLLPQLSSDPRWAQAAVNTQVYFLLAIVPLVAYCLTLVPKAGLVGSRRTGWATLAAIAALCTAFWADHTLVQTVVQGEAATGALRAGPGLVFAGFGPLAVVAGAAIPAMALLGLRLALQYRAEPRSRDGTSLLLLSAGFLVGGLFDGANRLVALADLLDSASAFPFTPWGWAFVVLPVFALVPAGLTVVVLATGRNLDPRPRHALETRILVIAGLAFFSGFLRIALPADSDIAGSPAVLLLLGTWRLAAPMFIGYAVLVRTTAAVESRAQEALAWVLLGALLAASGWMAALAAGQVLPSPVHAVAGLVAAALLCATAGRGLLVATRATASWLLPVPTDRRPAPAANAGPGAEA